MSNPENNPSSSTREQSKPDTAGAASKKTPAGTPLFVLFDDKDAAKAAGAKWDADAKVWYAPPGADLSKLEPWLATSTSTLDLNEPPEAAPKQTAAKRVPRQPVVLFVDFKDNDAVKAAGAKWDAEEKAWYAPLGADLKKLEKWAYRPLDVPMEQKDTVKALGCRWDPDKKLWCAPLTLDSQKIAPWRMVPLFVPSSEKDEAKALGARFNWDLKQWFAVPSKAKAPHALAPYIQELDARLDALIPALLDVPFDQKDQAKAAGARWDRQLKSWYIPGADLTLPALSKWVPADVDRRTELLTVAAQAIAAARSKEERIILDVPYEKKDEAKQLGAKWDADEKLWFTSPADVEKLSQWLPSPERLEQLQNQPSHDPKGRDVVAATHVLDVPYDDNDKVKALGAKFSGHLKVWYRPQDSDAEKFTQWTPSLEKAAEILAAGMERARIEDEKAKNRVELQVPYAEKEIAKLAGAKWDRDEKVWFTEEPAKLPNLARWATDKEPIPNSPFLNTLGIKPETLNATIFKGSWYHDANGENVIFRHTDRAEQIVGPNTNIVPNAPHRGPWSASVAGNVDRVVIFAHALESMSYHQINPTAKPHYFATGDGPIPEKILATLKEQAALVPVISAYPNTKEGAALHAQLTTALSNIKVERNAPTHGAKTWNEVVQLKEKDYIKSITPEQAPQAKAPKKSKGRERSR